VEGCGGLWRRRPCDACLCGAGLCGAHIPVRETWLESPLLPTVSTRSSLPLICDPLSSENKIKGRAQECARHTSRVAASTSFCYRLSDETDLAGNCESPVRDGGQPGRAGSSPDPYPSIAPRRRRTSLQRSPSQRRITARPPSDVDRSPAGLVDVSSLRRLRPPPNRTERIEWGTLGWCGQPRRVEGTGKGTSAFIEGHLPFRSITALLSGSRGYDTSIIEVPYRRWNWRIGGYRVFSTVRLDQR
jgi:hypothetical protein